MDQSSAPIKETTVAAPVVVGGDRRTTQLQREIELTRAQLGDTVAAIQERLQPRELVDQTLEYTRQWAREGVPKMMDVIKRNPGPTLLIAAGVGWFIYNRKKMQGADQYVEYGEESAVHYGGYAEATPYEESAGEHGPGRMHRMMDKVKDKASTLKEKASELTSKAKEKTSDLSHRMKDKTSDLSESARDKSGELTSNVKDYASHLGERTSDVAHRANDRIWKALQENPLAVGAIALAVGAAVGFLIPESEKESELMGEKRDQLMSQVRDQSDAALAKVGQVAQEAVSAAKSEAREQGMID